MRGFRALGRTAEESLAAKFFYHHHYPRTTAGSKCILLPLYPIYLLYSKVIFNIFQCKSTQFYMKIYILTGDPRKCPNSWNWFESDLPQFKIIRLPVNNSATTDAGYNSSYIEVNSFEHCN